MKVVQLIFALLLGSGLAGAQMLTSFVVVTDLPGKAAARDGIYATALDNPHILFAPLPSLASGRIGAAAVFKPASGLEYLDGATALAYGSGYLLAEIHQSGVIRYISILKDNVGAVDVAEIETLHYEHQPHSLGLALSQSGMLAITDSTNDLLILKSLFGRRSVEKVFQGPFASGVTSPAWAGDTLYVLRRNADPVVGLEISKLLGEASGSPIKVIPLPPAEPTAISTYKNVLYFLSNKGIYAQPLGGTDSLQETWPAALIRPGSFATFSIFGDQLLLLSADQNNFTFEARLIPVLVGSYGFPRENIHFLASLYRELNASRTPFLWSSDAPEGPFQNSLSVARFVLPKSAQDVSDTDLKELLDAIDNSFSARQAFLLPPVREKRDVLIFTLYGLKLQDTLTRRGLTRDHIASMRNDLLLENRIPNTYEDFLSQPSAYLRLTGGQKIESLAVPNSIYVLPNDLTRMVTPGTLLRLKGNQLVPVAFNPCYEEAVANGSNILRPLQITRPELVAAALGGQSWVGSLTSANRASVRLSSLSWRTVSPKATAATCEPPDTDLLMVRATLTAGSLSLSLWGPDQLLSLLRDQHPAGSIFNDADPNRIDFSPENRVLAFQAVPIKGPVPTGVANELATVEFSSLLNLTKGTVRIPISAWFTQVYLRVTDLTSSSRLGSLLAKPEVRVFPLETEESMPEATPSDVTAPVDAEALRKAREVLRSSVRMFDSNRVLRSAEERHTRVGLAENGTSLDSYHERIKGHVQWYPADPRRRPCNPEAMNQEKQCDHGTFVVGLLAGEDAIDPNLAEKLQTHFIELETDADSLSNDVGLVTKKCRSDLAQDDLCGVHIINFSQASKKLLMDGVMKQFVASDQTKEVLFIAAVDNATDVNIPPAYDEVLLKYLNDRNLSNYILGVTAGNTDRDLLPTAPRGKGFIHIIAPGDKVFGPVTNAGPIGAMSGTSVAVPQVTAAAALIAAQDGGSPHNVKPRLIYTADPLKHDYDSAVWGGFLNVFRAAAYVQDGLLVLPTSERIQYRVTLTDLLKREITFSGQILSETKGPRSVNNEPVPLTKLLRVVQLFDGKWRIIYLDNDRHLRIATADVISGSIAFKYIAAVYEDNKDGELTFTDVKLPEPVTQQEQDLPITRIRDYTAPIRRVEDWN